MSEQRIFIHEIKLEGEGQFVESFNIVSDCFARYEKLPEGKEKDEAWAHFIHMKTCLEMGII